MKSVTQGKLPTCECGTEVLPGYDLCSACVGVYPEWDLWGDGIHDDTQNIQDLLDNQLNVTLPSGKYSLNTTIDIHPGGSLRGEEGLVTLKSTANPVIRCRGGGVISGLIFMSSSGFIISRQGDIKIGNI